MAINKPHISEPSSRCFVRLVYCLASKYRPSLAPSRCLARNSRIFQLIVKYLVFRALQIEAFSGEPLSPCVSAKIRCDRASIASREHLYRNAIEPLRQRDRGLIAMRKHSYRKVATVFRLGDRTFGAFSPLFRRSWKNAICPIHSIVEEYEKN